MEASNEVPNVCELVEVVETNKDGTFLSPTFLWIVSVPEKPYSERKIKTLRAAGPQIY